MSMGTRGQQGRPSTAEVTDPQAAKESRIREVFKSQWKMLANLFPKDGEVILARAVSSAIMASRATDPKTGKRNLENVAAEEIAEKCIACHHQGLEPGADAYLVPYGGRITIIKSPQGLIKLMFNAGWRVVARAVREGDFFEHEMGTTEYVKHRKANGRQDSPVTFGYAIARHVNGGPETISVLSRDDIEAHRDVSAQKNGPMWSNFYEGAVRKTMIHDIANYIPLPASLMTSMRAEETGAVEVTDEIRELLRAMNAKPAEAPAPETAPLAAAPAEQGREPGGAP